MASVALMENVKVPIAVGVPEITPEGESVRPGGRLPLASENVYGLVPPPAVTVLL